MNMHLIELRSSTSVYDALAFWHESRKIYLLSTLAEDMVSTPASQAFVESIFSVCGMLTAGVVTGRRNRIEKSLKMSVILRMNAHIINLLIDLIDWLLDFDYWNASKQT